MVGFLLSVTFACGLFVAAAHVVNRRFIAPVYDVVANLTAFASAVAASILLHHWVPAALAAIAVGCWIALAIRTGRALRRREPLLGQVLDDGLGAGAAHDPHVGLDVRRSPVLDVAVHGSERPGHHGPTGLVERQPGPLGPLLDSAVDDHRAPGDGAGRG